MSAVVGVAAKATDEATKRAAAAASQATKAAKTASQAAKTASQSASKAATEAARRASTVAASSVGVALDAVEVLVPPAGAEVSPMQAAMSEHNARRVVMKREADVARKSAQRVLHASEQLVRDAVGTGLAQVGENQRVVEASSKGLHREASTLFAQATAWRGQQAALQKDALPLAGVEEWGMQLEAEVAALVTQFEEVVAHLKSA